MHYSYEELINNLNSGAITGFYFRVNGYAHYKKCSIFRKYDRTSNDKTLTRIEVNLTADGTEMHSFLKIFQDNFKLFNMGRKGKFTLKQLWDHITILEVIDSSMQ